MFPENFFTWRIIFRKQEGNSDRKAYLKESRGPISMMQSQYKIYFTIVLLCALGAGIVCARFVRKKVIDPNKNVAVVQNGPIVQVLVAKQDIRKGSEFTARNIKFMSFPETDVPRDVVFETKGFLGHKAANDIPKNSFLTLFDVRLLKEKEEVINTFLPAGYSNVPLRIESVFAGEHLGDISKFIATEEIVHPGDKVQVSVIRSIWEESETNSHRQVPKLATRVLVPSAVVTKVSSEIKTVSAADSRRYTILSLQLDKKSTDLIKKESGTGKISIAPINVKVPDRVNSSTVTSFNSGNQGVNQLTDVSRRIGYGSGSGNISTAAGNTGFTFGISLNNPPASGNAAAQTGANTLTPDSNTLTNHPAPVKNNNEGSLNNVSSVSASQKAPVNVSLTDANRSSVSTIPAENAKPAASETTNNGNFSFGINLNNGSSPKNQTAILTGNAKNSDKTGISEQNQLAETAKTKNLKPNEAAGISSAGKINLSKNKTDLSKESASGHDILEKSTVTYPVLPKTSFNPIQKTSETNNSGTKPLQKNISVNEPVKNSEITPATNSGTKNLPDLNKESKSKTSDKNNNQKSSAAEKNSTETANLFQNASGSFRARTK